jgi:hypothetical protein
MRTNLGEDLVHPLRLHRQHDGLGSLQDCGVIGDQFNARQLGGELIARCINRVAS